MKISTGLCLLLHLYITLAGVETNATAGLHNQRDKRLQNQLRIRVKGQKVDSADNKILLHLTHGRNKSDDYKEPDAKSRKTDHNRSHLQTIIADKRTPCEGNSCLRGKENAIYSKGILRRKLARRRRTESVFLAKALNLLDHSKPRELWDSTRASANKPYKQFTNGTGASNRSSNSTKTLIKKPVKNQEGNRRQNWIDLDNEMRPRFFFNSAPAEFVKQEPSSVHKLHHGAIHLTLPPLQTPLHTPEHLHRNGPVFHNHMHMVKNPGELSPMAINFFAHPVPQHIPGPLNLHINHRHLHHVAPLPPFAIHINAPPRLEPPVQTNVLSQQLSPVDIPTSMSPNMLGEQTTPINPPFGGEPHMIPPPDVPLQPNVPITPQDLPPNFNMMPPSDVPMHPNAPITSQDLPSNLNMMPPPDIPVPPPPIDTQGMPSPDNLPMPLMPPPPTVQKVPFPVPVPSPPKVEHVPYPIPVPGPPSIQPVMVPIHVPSPPKIQEVRVPVLSPPEIKNVPVPFPVAVPSPPRVQRIPYPVAFPVKGPPEIQKIFFPIAVPQPSRVHHVPYPIYIRYPPEIRTVPYPVPSPPKPYPVAVPSPPRLMIHREPYPILYPQKVPIPVPVVVQHHHIHHEGEESVINGQCLVNLCLNGGTCSAYMNTYRCHCPNGFQGKHCEEQNMCKPNPCRNFGFCSQVEHDYECTCTKGFIGKNCDNPDPCMPSPCENGATCSSDGTSYDCTCRIGWMGKNCQVESKCLPLNPCQNGGTCTEAQGTYKCECSPGWAGLSCEVSAPETLHPSVLCDNCHTSDDHMLEQMKRNKLRNTLANSKKGTVVRGQKQRT